MIVAMVSASTSAETMRNAVVAIDHNSVTVERTGLRTHQVSGDETVATCSRFRLTAADAREFFAKASRVDAQTYGHSLDGSNCVATGRAKTTDGRRGTWMIDLERRGELTLNGERLYYFCAKCSSRQYDEVDADAVARISR